MVDKVAYLLELSRYVVLNPVRVKGMARHVGDWAWSSYRAMVGEVNAPDWLMIDWLLTQFEENRSIARRRYKAFVQAGIEAPNVWDDLKGQIYLGDDQNNVIGRHTRRLWLNRPKDQF